MRVVGLLCGLALLVGASLVEAAFSAAVLAQEGVVCFPQTNHCIGGRFRVFWEQNGGLPVFGYPITGARPERNRDTNQVYLTQWFERNRFEYHPENQPPYDVLLGRLGDDRLRQKGINWQTQPPAPERPECLYFEQSGHNVCDQTEDYGFVRYWVGHGLLVPGLDDYGRSLALFGLPLTEARMETNDSGDTVLTQWFERARFEWHPNKPGDYRVLLGLLGREVGPPAIAGRVPPVNVACPLTHPIKGTTTSAGEKVYHVPGGLLYPGVVPEVCFATEADAQAAGYRRAPR